MPLLARPILMSFYSLRTWYYTIDPELRLIHAFQDCKEVKIARRYSYSYEVKVNTPDDARTLDDLIEDERYKTCDVCYRREQSLARRDKRRPRPGFLHPPRGYKAPPPVRRVPKKNVTRD